MPSKATLPETGFLRLRAIVAPHGVFPVSRSVWGEGVRDGRYPKPVKLSERVTAWRVEDIRDLIERTAAA
ncbi:MAG: AlpA family phage regulatory protein [Hyphomicrobiales bacterium]|nr:AlpA family phage regulatory protein [Hyphomicrobiales bacterium]